MSCHPFQHVLRRERDDPRAPAAADASRVDPRGLNVDDHVVIAGSPVRPSDDVTDFKVMQLRCVTGPPCTPGAHRRAFRFALRTPALGRANAIFRACLSAASLAVS